MTERILPYHPDAQELDGPGRFRLSTDPVGTLRFHAYQDESITRALSERTSAGGTGGVLLADEQGGGKTAVSCEVIARAGFRRVLISVLVDTIPQWRDRLVAQGAPEPRVMDGKTKGGEANFAAFLAGEDGIFITGSAVPRPAGTGGIGTSSGPTRSRCGSATR